ncbi:MAG TPA: VanZ family protein [Patescibacteria group bacterium]|nr:VanZ family protein [Patescibacteria group bacterium]
MAAAAKKILRFLNLWLPPVAVMSAIFYASSLPGRNIPNLFSFQDVFFHGTIYACLGFFLARALRKTYTQAGFWKIVLCALACGFIYSLTDEFHQRFVPGRSADMLDVTTDVIGTFIGSLLYR